MRVHPISLAMQYLRGRLRASHRRAFADRADAFRWLRECTGQDFGTDVDAWAEWLRKNRTVYYRPADPNQQPSSTA